MFEEKKKRRQEAGAKRSKFAEKVASEASNSSGAERKRLRKLAKWLTKNQSRDGTTGSQALSLVQQKLKNTQTQAFFKTARKSQTSQASPTRDASLLPLPCIERLNPPVQGFFLDSSHPQFQSVLDRSYPGFQVEKAEDLPTKLHADFQRALESLEVSLIFRALSCHIYSLSFEFDSSMFQAYGLYQFDITQPFGLKYQPL